MLRGVVWVGVEVKRGGRGGSRSIPRISNQISELAAVE